MIFQKKNRIQERKVSFALFAVFLMVASAFVCMGAQGSDAYTELTSPSQFSAGADGRILEGNSENNPYDGSTAIILDIGDTADFSDTLFPLYCQPGGASIEILFYNGEDGEFEEVWLSTDTDYLGDRTNTSLGSLEVYDNANGLTLMGDAQEAYIWVNSSYQGSTRTFGIQLIEAEPPETYTHTLIYNANGGTGAPSQQSETDSNTTKSMTISSTKPTRSGYTFLGWAKTSTAASAQYQSGSTVSVGANETVTLYAVWKAAAVNYTHTLKYNANGGTGTMSNTVVTNTSQTSNVTIASNSFARSGYTFLGWATSSTAASAQYQSGNAVSVGANETVTLYAVWEKNTLTASVTPFDSAIYGQSYLIQIDASANHSAPISYAIKSCSGGDAEVDSTGRVFYDPPSSGSSKNVYTVVITVTATFSEGGAITKDLELPITVYPVLGFLSTPSANAVVFGS